MGVDLERIAGSRLFAPLAEDAQRALAALAEEVVVAEGAVILEEGQPASELYVVVAGRVSLCMKLVAGAESCFLTLGAGEMLGWSGLLRRRWVATARAVEPTTLLRFRASDLLSLCEQQHHVGYVIMSQAFEEMADRLQQTRLQLLDLFGKPSSDRLGG
ncbi:MAG: cyclic nucleotide-binding domain-containing protein [Myxococcales bacterium]|nr:cyclic nucleotide-binding domain-containing protein [Myxococcales bacterium]